MGFLYGVHMIPLSVHGVYLLEPEPKNTKLTQGMSLDVNDFLVSTWIHELYRVDPTLGRRLL